MSFMIRRLLCTHAAANISYTTETPGPNPQIGEVFKSETPLSQLPLTLDKTDYFWYSTTVTACEEMVCMLSFLDQKSAYFGFVTITITCRTARVF